MSTPNFCKYEAKNYFAIGTDENDEFIYNDTKENIYHELKALAEKHKYTFYQYDANRMYHAIFNRSYGGSYITSIEESKWIGDIEITVILHAVLSGGYYQGATLDYISEIQLNGDDRDNIDEFIKYFDYKELEYYSEMPIGMQKIQSKNIEKFVRTAYDEMTEQIEAIYENHCEEKLVRICVFSNGEAIYERAS